MSSYLAQFNYQITGPANGRRWVFLHGLMGYAMNWRRIVTGLGSQEQVLTYDQRGHGKSWKPLTGYAAEDYADDLFLITQELGWEQFILVGHSMGGHNALEFAHKFPEKVSKLVIEDIGPDGATTAIDYYKWLFSIIPTPFENKLKAKEFFLNDFKPFIKGKTENPDTLGQYLYSNLIETEAGKADWRFSKEAMLLTVTQGRAKDRWNEFRSLPMPTLVIRGANSKELRKEVYDKMLLSNPRVQGVEIPNAGHWVHSEQPEEFLRAIRKFTDSAS